jgi:PAP2 superfamily
VLAVALSLFVSAGLAAQEEATTPQEECPAIDLPESPDPSADQVATPRPSLASRVSAAFVREARRYRSDSVALIKAPLTWDKGDWEKLAGGAIIVGGLMFADRSIDSAAQRNRSHATNSIASASTPLGSQYGFELSGTLWIAGTLLNHENMRETGRDAVEAGVLAYVLNTGLLKRLFGRERPRDSGGRTVFVPGSSHDSFPSGHTTEAFAVASVIAARSKSWPIPVIAYSLASLVAFDRINTRDHFASDVVAGAFLGTAVGHFLVHRHGEQEKGVLSKATLEIVPIRHGLAAQIGF